MRYQPIKFIKLSTYKSQMHIFQITLSAPGDELPLQILVFGAEPSNAFIHLHILFVYIHALFVARLRLIVGRSEHIQVVMMPTHSI